MIENTMLRYIDCPVTNMLMAPDHEAESAAMLILEKGQSYSRRCGDARKGSDDFADLTPKLSKIMMYTASCSRTRTYAGTAADPPPFARSEIPRWAFVPRQREQRLM